MFEFLGKRAAASRDCLALFFEKGYRKDWKGILGGKANLSPGVFSVDLREMQDSNELVANRVGTYPFLHITDADFCNDFLVMRNYYYGLLFERDGELEWTEVVKKNKPVIIPFPIQKLGESACFSADEKSVILSSKNSAAFWKIDLSVPLYRSSK